MDFATMIDESLKAALASNSIEPWAALDVGPERYPIWWAASGEERESAIAHVEAIDKKMRASWALVWGLPELAAAIEEGGDTLISWKERLIASRPDLRRPETADPDRQTLVTCLREGSSLRGIELMLGWCFQVLAWEHPDPDEADKVTRFLAAVKALWAKE